MTRTPSDPVRPPGETVDEVAGQALGLLSLAVARRDEGLFRTALARCRDHGLNADQVREALLQSHLFLGYPACIWAMEQLHAHAPADWLQAAPPYVEEPTDPVRMEERGWRLFRAVYGPVHERLYAKVTRLHPDLARWMVREGYGRVLSRPPLAPALRELCIVAMLAHTRHWPQLRSHVIGALRLGVVPDVLRRFWEELRPYLEPGTVHRLHTWLQELTEGGS